MDKPKKAELKSMDVADDKRRQLALLFPEVVTEIRTDDGKLVHAVGYEILKGVLGEFSEVLEKQRERYGMTWPGKNECLKIIQQPSVATLKPCRDESVRFDDSENLFIEGDNLEVLKLLQKAYYGKVKMIYIDPPYNTGKDFVYPDDFSESLETYLAYTGQKDVEGRKFSSNTEGTGRFHSKWMRMMYPRLYLSKNLLSDDGVMLISIDEKELSNLRKICDEVFGEENFAALFAVVNNLKGRNDQRNVSTCHEYIIAYAKPDFLSLGLPLTDEQRAKFKYTDENGEPYDLRDLRKRGRPDRREDRPNMWFPIYFNKDENSFALERQSPFDIEITPKRGDGTDGRWRWGKERVAANLDILKAKFTKKSEKWDISHRVYLNQVSTTPIDGGDDLDEDEETPLERTSQAKSIWMGGELSTDVGRRTFKALIPEAEIEYPKPVDLLKRCIYYATSNDDIVLDFFAGSCTTAQAVLELNVIHEQQRRFICVQLPEPFNKEIVTDDATLRTIADLGKLRIKRVIEELEQRQQEDNDSTDLQDNGFRVFKLDRSNFRLWDGSQPGEDLDKIAMQLELHEQHIDLNASQEDILYELLLKTGFPLTIKVEKVVMAGKELFSIAEGALIICLQDEITKELIKAIADTDPFQVICLDSGFKNNDQLKANAVQTFKARNRGKDKKSAIVFHTV